MPLIEIADSDVLRLTWRIEAPRPRVWQCLTEGDLLRQWLGNLVSGQVAAGSDFELDHGDGYVCRSSVTTWIREDQLDFTWHFPDEPASAVRLVLQEQGEVTHLQLRHSGLDDLSQSYRDGWCVHLTYLEAAALGTPLPASMFWQLHGTVARLNRR